MTFPIAISSSWSLGYWKDEKLSHGGLALHIAIQPADVVVYVADVKTLLAFANASIKSR